MHISFSARTEAIVVFIAALFLLLSNIWGYPVTILDEAKNTEAAREMFVGNHFYPSFNEMLRTDKPPLHYFFMQWGYAIFGVNELGARFFGSLLGALFTGGFFLFLRKHATLSMARLAVFILLASFFWVQEFHLAVPDPYLLVFLCGSWLLFYDFWVEKKNSKRNWSLWLFYIFVGLATLAKGPVAIGLSGLIVLIFILLKKEFSIKEIMQYRPFLGSLLVLLIAAPWFVWMHFQTEGLFTQGFFLDHNFNRFGSEREGHGGIFLITWGFVILGLFPFGAFIPQGLWHGWKFLKRNDLILYSFIISVTVIVFFSISATKLPNYTLPAIPFLAILVAGFFEETETFGTIKKWYNTTSMGLISLVMIALPVAVFILFEHLIILNKQLIYSGIILVICAALLIFMWQFYWNEKGKKLIMTIGFGWMLLGCMIFYLIYPQLAKTEPVMQAAKIIENKEVAVFESYDPAFNFNYKRNFREIHGIENLIQFSEENPDVLILTKDRRIRDHKYIHENFQTIFNEPSVFENYRTVILKKW